ncbi:CocE/NonD family hydrolase [Pseudonocardia kujensis]|uniref:CocE/NonD family hydrolase n=1 Tax=Pseudonocardia kujensis TaxID=1128675 RepID=UPI001E32C312|nr:CocE/NonD family hydrolase [Pseudonocardia kujensis]MCE0764095.1 CocE/NonD family hydrolase [Pseudonocardia kujensis]
MTERKVPPMIVERDVPIPMEDGVVLRADVFRPDTVDPAPVIMTLGPYGKGVKYEEGFAPQWQWMMRTHPDVLPGSTRSMMAWETVDPETWVPWGYACVRVDSRGAGRSPGVLDIFSPREIRDYYEAIEWAGLQPWSTGKVGLNGISYYAVNQWHVAALQPPHLTAMIPWEGAADFYRDWARHGGIASNGFLETWYPRQVLSVQHGNPEALTDPYLGELASGPDKLDEEELRRNRSDPLPNILARELDGPWYRDRSPDWSKVTVPFLSAASLAGYGLHPRGNFEAFVQAASELKWLETHPGRHEEWFYLEYGLDLQKRFLDHFLKGIDNGWDREPRVQLNIRRPFSTEVEQRGEESWPLPDTRWTELRLSAADRALGDAPADSATVTFDALGEPVTFLSAPLQEETELTGPLAVRLHVSSSTTDADLFVTLQAFAPDGREVEFQGTIDPHTPLAQGWLRASHRALDEERSLPWRPYHRHDQLQKLAPGEVVTCDVEIWPTSIVLPAGYHLALQVSGHDFEREPPEDPNEAWVSRGSGPWLHNHPEDRPLPEFGGRTTLHTGPDHDSVLLVPVIPPR